MEITASYKFILVLFGGMIAITFFALGVKLLLSDSCAYDSNRKKCGKFVNPLKGTVPSFNNGNRDYRVCAGLSINRKNQWTEQGALCEESVDSILA